MHKLQKKQRRFSIFCGKIETYDVGNTERCPRGIHIPSIPYAYTYNSSFLSKMVRCTAKTALGRRCKKTGTRDGLCHIHESAAPVAIDPRRSRGGGPALGHQPQRPLRANREGHNDGARAEYTDFMQRRSLLLQRFQRIMPINGGNPRAFPDWRTARNQFVEMNRGLSTLSGAMAPLRHTANRKLSQTIKERLDDFERRIREFEARIAEQNRIDAERERVLEAARQRAREIVAEQAIEIADAERRVRQQQEHAAQLREDLRLRPVVFRRDPEGGIDLRAFAADTQSVHRSSVQNATHKAVVELLSRQAPPADQETLSEIVGIFNTSTKIRWVSLEARDSVVTELTDNYFNAIAFNIAYGRVVDYLWAYIRSHAEKDELVQRLAEELYEGRGMCANGKMARLINVVQGYDESLATAAPRELFQQRMGELSSKPAAERESAARELFAEFRIPITEHAAWLEPLLEA